MLISQCSEKVVWRKKTVSEDRARNKRTGMRENRFLYVCTAVGIHIPFEDKMNSQWTSWRSQSRRVEIKPHFVTVIYDLDAAVIHWKTVRYFLGGLKRCWISFEKNLRRNKLIHTWYTHAVLSTTMGRVTGQYYKHFLNMLNSYLAWHSLYSVWSLSCYHAKI